MGESVSDGEKERAGDRQTDSETEKERRGEGGERGRGERGSEGAREGEEGTDGRKEGASEQDEQERKGGRKGGSERGREGGETEEKEKSMWRRVVGGTCCCAASPHTRWTCSTAANTCRHAGTAAADSERFFFESRLPRATRHPPEDERTRGGGREGRACCVRETVRLGLCLRLFENSDCACSRTWSLAACAVCAHGPCLRESLGAPSSSDSCCCCSACACMFMVCGIVCVRVDI